MSKKTAFITGINGQDGYYLSKLLLKKNYRVIGLSRNSPNTKITGVEYLMGDMTNKANLRRIITEYYPDEIYNLASMSHPHKSWQQSLQTSEINAFAAHQLFEMAFEIYPECRIFQASSSQMLGDQDQVLKNPYAISKIYAHHIAKTYRAYHKKFISCGILFNHESPERGMHFITQKISYAAACIKLGIDVSAECDELNEPIVKNKKIYIGDLAIKRDWGHASDFVYAMWLMLQAEKPDDYIVATGIQHSIQQLCEIAFSYAGLNWENHVVSDQRFYRGNETSIQADISKITRELAWMPSVTFKDLIANMVDHHLKSLEVFA